MALKLDQSLKLAKKKIKEGYYGEASLLYRNILKKFPANKKAKIGLNSMSGFPSGITPKVQNPPQNQLTPLINLYGQEQFQQALDQAKGLLELFPNSILLYNIVGSAYSAINQHDAAIDGFKAALRIKPDFAEAYNNMGNVLLDKGDLDGALNSFKRAIKIKPENAEFYNSMGDAFRQKNEMDAAIACYKQALKIKPESIRPVHNMASAFHNKGEFKAAIENYTLSIQRGPSLRKSWDSIESPLRAIKLKFSSEEEFFSLLPEDKSSQYAQIRNSILKHQLSLGSANSESYLERVVELLSKATDINIINPEMNKNQSDATPPLSEKIVALVHFGRSGTGLLHSLIDGHPEVSTMPSIYFSEYFDHSVWKTITKGGWSEIANRFIANYEVLFDASASAPILTKSAKRLFDLGTKEGLANVGPGQDEVLKVDKALFRTELRRLMKNCHQLDALTFFKLVHAAYNKAIDDLNDKNLIFYHIHNPDLYAKFNFTTLAPNAEWVMMVREPIQSLESWLRCRFSENNYSSCCQSVLSMLFEVDNIIYHKQNSVGVRLEDLKNYPRKTIPALCMWLGIDEHESLYEMTAQGKKWWGDASSPDFAQEGMDPFGKTAINRGVGSIFSESDRFILSTLFHPFSVQFGYIKENSKQFKADLQKVRPMLDEMFDFEKTLAERTKVKPEDFMSSGSFLLLRAGLIDRWNVLNQHHTYPNMITPLFIS